MSARDDNARQDDPFPQDELRAVEKAIRRIVRASDLQSRTLVKTVGLTAPQLFILRAIAALGEVTTTALSAHADLSPATVVTVLDNLEERGLIDRYRSLSDRRVVHTRLTARGRAVVARAPEALGDPFAGRFFLLPAARRRQIVEAARQLADMMAREAPAAETAALPARPDEAAPALPRTRR
ncbi:MarR family transcriptional regulator [Aquibium sp. A9E412]|uniref:MarR family winged helix-turn-helix transcriptional regulator n=1 Tax=Aquibium sp. A9E412 TaxID=2976767 RepID=UPI0025B22EED|nr:MarR family transcriptional regulator [Aquibium sp. A9E412]MDN2565868.1 MarR family transcriptional regulator [Aquibium sp. A9E412]